MTSIANHPKKLKFPNINSSSPLTTPPCPLPPPSLSRMLGGACPLDLRCRYHSWKASHLTAQKTCWEQAFLLCLHGPADKNLIISSVTLTLSSVNTYRAPRCGPQCSRCCEYSSLHDRGPFHLEKITPFHLEMRAVNKIKQNNGEEWLEKGLP